MMKMEDTKNGKAGILNLTNEPKFATVRPTEKEKNKANSMANMSIGFFLM